MTEQQLRREVSNHSNTQDDEATTRLLYGNTLDSLRMILREEQQLTKSNSNHDFSNQTGQAATRPPEKARDTTINEV